MKNTRLILTRHGETEENKQNILMGQMPGILSSTGIQQAHRLQELTIDTPLDIIFCSDLKRSRDTAQIVAQSRNLPIVESILLREMDWGVYTGKTLKDIDWNNLPESVESIASTYQRAEMFLQMLRETYAGKCILAVGHGAINRVITAVMQGKNTQEMLQIPIMKNTAFVEFIL